MVRQTWSLRAEKGLPWLPSLPSPSPVLLRVLKGPPSGLSWAGPPARGAYRGGESAHRACTTHVLPAARKGTRLPEAPPGGASGLRSESERWEGLQRSLGLGWGSWQRGPVVPPPGGALDGPWWPLPDPALAPAPGQRWIQYWAQIPTDPDTRWPFLSFPPALTLTPSLSPSDHMRWATLPGDPGPRPSQFCSGPPLLSPVFGAHRGQPEGHRASITPSPQAAEPLVWHLLAPS